MDRAPQDSSSEDGDKLEPEGLDYKEIAREVLARIDERLADLERDHPSPRSEAPFHAQTVSDIMGADRRAALVRMVGLGFIGLLLSASLVAAVSLLWSSRDSANRNVAQSVPQLDVGTSTPADREPRPPATSQTIAEVATQAAPLPRATPDNDTANPAPGPAELADLVRKVDRDVGNLVQAVTELRLAQQQATDDKGKTVEDIKASLERMARAMARADTARTDRAPVQAAPPKPPAPAPRATPPGPRRLAPVYGLPE